VNGFIFASGVNEPGKNDADGSFRPGAQTFRKIHDVPQSIFYFDHNDSSKKTRQKILDKLWTAPCEDPDGFDFIAYFGHGTKTSLSSAGFKDKHAQDLAAAIIGTSKHEVKVILYACSAGYLPTSFASELSKALNSTAATVIGHQIGGHSWANPHYTVFEHGSPGRYLVPKSSPYWSGWERAINDGNKFMKSRTLWARFPFMSEDEIDFEVAGD
jgi:hypothetical protein